MNRRQVLAAMGVAFGAALIVPLSRMIEADKEIDPIALTSSQDLFSEEERASVSALSEIIIPTTDTPGAIEAGVPQYIEFMLAEWYQEDERDRFMEGLSQVAAYANDIEDAVFAQLDAGQQTAIVQRMHDGEAKGMDEGGSSFFDHIKQLTLAGYYTSEVGMTMERVYLPVPGRFDGSYPYEEVGTLFTY